MVAADNTIIQYKKIVHELNDLRNLLRTKLIQLKAIDANVGYPSFNTLVSKVTPTDINSIINYNLPNVPIDTTRHFNTTTDISNYLDSNVALSEMNLLLIKKILFYREYLKHQLRNMGINEKDIKKDDSLKGLILLLNKVEKVKDTRIICDTDILYANYDNVLGLTVYDETDIEVTVGTIEIYDGNILLYSYDVSDDIIIRPTLTGNKTYTLKYINEANDVVYDKYNKSEINANFRIIQTELDGTILLQNITATSKYYTGNIDDTEGYQIDNWDINVNITNHNGQTINHAIPFKIYIGNESHLLYSGETNTLGNKTISNINIPYYSSNFNNFREKAVTFFALIDIDNDDEPIINKLSFIKDPTLENDEITYKRVKFTENNYLDDLNGCVTNISIQNNTLQYTTFQTNQHIKISEVNNLENIVQNLVTELFHNKSNNTLDYETIFTNKYEYVKDEFDTSIPIILKTEMNSDDYIDAILTHPITLYHIPLYINHECLEWYKTDPNMPNAIPITICDELTGLPLSYNEETYNIQINDDTDIVDDKIYYYPININNLPYGENTFNVVLLDEDLSNILNMDFIINVLSNFTLPSETLYYLNDTPDFYYMPKGQPKQSQQVNITTNKTNLNGAYYTQATGLIHGIKQWTIPGTYEVTLTAASQGFTEQRNFTYEIKKPFDYTITNYKKTESITYQINIYDKEHFNWDNNSNITNHVVVKNNNKNVAYTYTYTTSNTKATYNITIPCNSNTYGTNTLTITINGYSESTNFKLYEKLFTLQTTTTNLGLQTIEVLTYDNELNNITINGAGIEQRSVSKVNNTFLIECMITQASPNGTTLYMSNNDDITENATIIIPKFSIDSEFYIDTPKFYETDNNHNYIHWDIDSAPVSETITIIFNNGLTNATKTQNIGSSINNPTFYDYYNVNLSPGTYTAFITFNGSNNYNSFTKSLTYTVKSVITYLSNIDFDNNNDLLITTVTSNEINNTSLISDIDILNDDLVITSMNISNDEDSNLENIITTINIDDNKDLTTKK